MKEDLKSIERIYDFDEYLNECAEFFQLNITSNGNTLNSSPSSGSGYTHGDGHISERVNGLGGLPTNYADALQDIRRILDKLVDGIKTGLKNPSDVYSTDAKDYGG